MRVTHVITRLVVGGAQENTVATVLGLRKKSGVRGKFDFRPDDRPGRFAGTLGGEDSAGDSDFTIVPELVRASSSAERFSRAAPARKNLLRTKTRHRPHAQRQGGNRRAARRQACRRAVHHPHDSRPVVRQFSRRLEQFYFHAPPNATPPASPIISSSSPMR